MKIFTLATVGLGLFALSSCGVADRHEEINELNKKTKWDEDLTNQAIDIYIEGLEAIEKYQEDYILIQEKLDLESNIDRYGDRDVKKARKKDIKEAEKNLKEVKKQVEKEYKVKSPRYDEYSYDTDEYAVEDEYDY